MDDLVEMKVVHSPGDAHGPVHEQGWGDLPARSQDFVQLSLSTVLHNDAVTWSLSTNTSEKVERKWLLKMMSVLKLN